MHATRNTTLIIYENSSQCKSFVTFLKNNNLKVDSTSNAFTGLEYLNLEHYDVIFLSVTIPLFNLDELLKRIRKIQPFSKIILIGLCDELKISILEKKFNLFGHVSSISQQNQIDQVLKQIQTALEVAKYKIIGSCSKMKSYFSMLEKVMKSSVTVLIHGESGTGKELTARALHEGGPRAGKPFVTVNCATIPENLLESELFGHEKGSFTGAVARRIGKFELANKGTIFLDEIGELSHVIQAKFLRVLEEQSFERVGGNESVRVDVRIISATNRNLKEMVKQNLFREDLFYRLNPIPIFVPPLRDKKEDIPELVEFFMEKYLSKTGKTNRMMIDKDALNILKNYNWPGNIRELENVIMRSMVLTETAVIEMQDLPEDIITQVKTQPEIESIDPAKHDILHRVCSMQDIEKEAIEKALIASDHNASKAARLLKIGRMTFYRKIKMYSIQLRT